MPIVDDREFLLLSNMLDGLDRLYDQVSGVVDVYALLQATAAALPDSPIAEDLVSASSAVAELLRSFHVESDRNLAALAATDDLRLKLAELWGDGYAERHPPGEGVA